MQYFYHIFLANRNVQLSINEKKTKQSKTDDDYEEMRFLVKQAKAQVVSWKAHILRSIHEDSARIDLLESLNESSVLVIQDLAMKYLPRKYHESQTDWFGK